MFKWLTGPNAAAVATRHALRTVVVALTAVAVDQGLLGEQLGNGVLHLLGALFGS